METTLYIQDDILKKITMAAHAGNMSRSELIVVLFKKAMDDVSRPSRFGGMVQYQQRNNREKRKVFHLVLREDDYEYLLDLRKLLKMSVSLILAIVVNKFIGKPAKIIITDNNRYKNYVIIKEMVGGIICWRFFWGYPPNIETYIQS